MAATEGLSNHHLRLAGDLIVVFLPIALAFVELPATRILVPHHLGHYEVELGEHH